MTKFVFSPSHTSEASSRIRTSGAGLALVMMLLAILGGVVAFPALAQAQDDPTVGCGTSVLEHTERLNGVTLVGNAGPSEATHTISLPATLAKGTYAVRVVAQDDHATEQLDEPNEQFLVTIGRKTTGPSPDLPVNDTFIGATTATVTDNDTDVLPAEVLPGAFVGAITLTQSQNRITLTHIDAGAGTEANSISPVLVSVACVVHDLTITFANDTTTVGSDGTVRAGFTVSNTSDSRITGIRVRSVLPTGVDRSGEVLMTAGTVSTVGATLRWEGNLNPGESAEVSFEVSTSAAGLQSCAAAGGSCVLTAEIAGTDTGIPLSPTASTQLTGASDLEVTTTYQPANGSVTSLSGLFTVVITNQPTGLLDVSAEDVVVFTDLADELSVDPNSFGATAGTVVAEQDGHRWTIDALNPGESAAYSFGVSLPQPGSYSARSQVLSASVADIDATAGSLPGRTGSTDVVSLEDDESAVLAIAQVPATTTTSTTTFTTTSVAPTTTVVAAADDNAEPQFKLVLPVEEPPVVEPPVEEDPADLTDVAGVVEERETQPIAVIDVQQNSKLPLALGIAGTLLFLSALIVLADRRTGNQLQTVTVTPEQPARSRRTRQDDDVDPWSSYR